LVDSFHQATVDGRTEVETSLAIHQRLAAIVADLRASAADDVLVDASNFYADQFAWLQQRGAAACYQFGRSGIHVGGKPEAMTARELNIEMRIVRSASGKPDIREPAPEVWKKLYKKLASRGVSKGDIDLIDKNDLGDGQHARYCAVMILFYREISALPQAEAAQVIRSVLATK
jgi:hypothetical protein